MLKTALALVLFSAVIAVLRAEVDIPTLPIGSPAPAFALPGVDGRVHRLEDFAQARILVVIFTCNHCPTAQAYEGRIKQLVTDYKDRGVAFVAISPNDPQAVRLDELGWTDLGDSLADMKLRAAYKQFNYPYLYDGETQSVSRAYGPKATPHVFIFDQARLLRYCGRIDDNERHPDQVTSRDARAAIEALLAGQAPAVTQTRTFGCSIKWSDKRASVQEALAEWAKEPVTLETVAAGQVQELFKNNSGKLRLINFWATWCGPCVIEFPDLVTINRMYRNRDFEMITLSMDSPEEREKALTFLKKQQSSARNLIFDGNPYALFDEIDKVTGKQLSSGALPYTILVKPGGEVLYQHEGRVDPLELKRAIVGYVGNTYR
jgi:thiol-disulfide isomerase/thioredoxin